MHYQGRDAKDAIVKPAEPLGGSYTEEALRWIISETQGYPYFIQELCSAIWEHLNPEQTVIGMDDVKGAVLKFYENLDRGFYRLRYDRCTPKEKMFIFAMAKCEKLPCSISKCR